MGTFVRRNSRFQISSCLTRKSTHGTIRQGLVVHESNERTINASDSKSVGPPSSDPTYAIAIGLTVTDSSKIAGTGDRAVRCYLDVISLNLGLIDEYLI